MITQIKEFIFSLKINNTQRLVTFKIWPTNLNIIIKIKDSTLVFRSVPVVSWRSVGRGVIFRCLSGVVTRGRVILRSFDVVGRSSVSSGIILRCLGIVVLEGLGVVAGGSIDCSVILENLGLANRSLCLVVVWSRVILGFLGVVNWSSVCGCVIFGLFGVVLGDFGVAARCSVGCDAVNWSLGVIFRYNVVRRSSRCVVSWTFVILGNLSCSCVARGRVILWDFGVVAREA
jgi:hypothetical protein